MGDVRDTGTDLEMGYLVLESLDRLIGSRPHAHRWKHIENDFHNEEDAGK